MIQTHTDLQVSMYHVYVKTTMKFHIIDNYPAVRIFGLYS